MSDEDQNANTPQVNGDASHRGLDLDDIADKVHAVQEQAAQQVSEDMDATRSEWQAEFEHNREELIEDIEEQKENFASATHAVTHPEEIVDGIKKAGVHAEHKVAGAVDLVTHPDKVKSAVEDHIEHVKEDAAALGERVSSSLNAPIDKVKLPPYMRFYGILCILCGAVALPVFAWMIWKTCDMFATGQMAILGVSTIVVTFLHLTVLVCLSIVFIILGIHLLRNKRRRAALLCYALYVLIILAALCEVALFGAKWPLLVYLVLFIATIAVQSYLDPHLRAERHEYHDRKAHEDLEEAKAGTLGRDKSGKGYITLNFFNLFWVFVVCSIIGLYMEEIVHFLIVQPGVWQDRAGLLYGPFSPIYGCGAVLMTLALNRFHDKSIIFIFFVSAIIGGAFEYFTSFFMQYAYGAVAWNYTGQWLSIGGRTCGWAMGCWGLLGVIWIKLLLPLMLRIVNLIPWNLRYAVTVIAALLMLADIAMSLMALDCWYERLAGKPVDSDIQRFFAQYYDNAWMAERFQSMTIDPSMAARSGGKL